MTHVCGCWCENGRTAHAWWRSEGSGERSITDWLCDMYVPSSVMSPELIREVLQTQPITELLLTSCSFVCRNLLNSQEGKSSSSSIFLSSFSPAVHDADESFPLRFTSASRGFCGCLRRELLSRSSFSFQTLQEGGELIKTIRSTPEANICL